MPPFLAYDSPKGTLGGVRYKESSPLNEPSNKGSGHLNGLRAILLSLVAALFGATVFTAVHGGLIFPGPGQTVLVTSKFDILKTGQERIPRQSAVVLAFPLLSAADVVDSGPSTDSFTFDMDFDSGMRFEIKNLKIRHEIRPLDAQQAVQLSVNRRNERLKILPELYQIAVLRSAPNSSGTWSLSDADVKDTFQKTSIHFQELAAEFAIDAKVLAAGTIKFPLGSDSKIRELRDLHQREVAAAQALSQSRREFESVIRSRTASRESILSEVRSRYAEPIREAQAKLTSIKADADQTYETIQNRALDRRELLELEAETIAILARYEAEGLTEMADAMAEGGDRVMDYVLATEVMPQLEDVGTIDPGEGPKMKESKQEGVTP